MKGDERRAVAALSAREAGEDHVDPYEDVDIAELPEWWRDAIAEFRTYGLRPYRPPRFADGAYKHETTERIEAEFDVDIEFVCFEVEDGEPWEIRIDGETVGLVQHRRSPSGYSVFEMGSSQFESLVSTALSRDDSA